MEHTDDLLLAVVRYAPLLFIVGGLLFVAWLSRQLSAQELQPEVLAALSETEALPVSKIRYRPPLDARDVDVDTLGRILDELCGAGLVIRWYESVEPTAADRTKLAVYRRLKSVTGTAS